MKIKKLITSSILVAFLISEFSFINFGNIAIAANTDVRENVNLEEYSKDYYGRQLSKNSKKFYDVLVKMYQDELLQKGVDYDLVKNGVVEEEELLKYASGTTQLLYDMTAARDAFQFDYPEVFWVDWSAVSLRVTRNTKGEYFAFLGRGKRDNYFLPGFNANNIETAINDYNSLMNQAVNAITTSAKQEEDEQSKKYELAKAAHDWEMNQMSYKFEYEVQNFGSNSIAYSNARTSYDCLKYGEGVCESYTRAYKAILDKLQIPCIVAVGGYKVSDTQTEQHAWNYVKIGEKWFGVDVTHDDDTSTDRQSHKFFMVGSAELLERRMPSGIFSQSLFEFGYPTLATSSLQDIEEEYDEGLFKVKVITSDYVEEGEHAGDAQGEVLKDTFRVWVSYNRKNYTQNEKDGKYIMARFATFNESTNEWKYTNWGYITPKLYPMLEKAEKEDEELGSYIDFQLPQVQLVQFAVTDVGPKVNEQGIPEIGEMYYKGDASLLTERTKEFINETGNLYVAPPYIQKATPPQNVKLGFESTYRVKIEYDDSFEVKDGSDTGKLEITNVFKPNMTTRNDLIASSKLSNIEYHLGDENENAWVEFDFTPSAQFSANEVAYDISWKGVVGKASQKEPMPANYAVGNKCDFCSLSGQGIDCNVFAQPELMDTSNLSASTWKTRDENGNEVNLPQELANADLSQLSHRLTLTTISIADDESKEMVDSIKEDANRNKVTESYNIRMQLCKKQVVNTGNSVRIRLGFPEGTSYEDYLSGTREFKVYHYSYDSLGNITGYNLIPVEVVPQGLILYVDSFSPFTISALEVPEEQRAEMAQAAKEKVLMLSSTEGGSITYGNSEVNKIEMKDKDEVTITIRPNEGQTIESLAVGTKVVELKELEDQGNGTYTLNIKTADLENGTTIVYAKFMSSIIVQEDIDSDHGEQVEQPEENGYTDTTDPDGNGYCDIVAANSTDTQTTIEKLINEKKVPGVKVEILDKDNNVIEDMNALVGTGMKIKISNELNADHVFVLTEIVVKGDINGDGKMGPTDVSLIRNGKMDNSLEGSYFHAADYDGNGIIGPNDITKIRKDKLLSK